MTGETGGLKLGELPKLPDKLLEFAAAWRNWRGDAMLPSRGQIKLDEIGRLLPRVMVLEVLSPGEALFRLVGTAYLELFGVELTGLNFVDLATPENRAMRGERLWAMATTPCGSYMSSPDPNPGRVDNILHTLTLPVQPEQPDQPMQFFGLTYGTMQMNLSDNYDEDLLKRLANQFNYIDIGAGLPTGR